MFEPFQGRSLIKFTQTFPDSEKCKQYLAELKWKDGFKCPSCGHTHGWEGVKPYTKVCKKCRFIESVTANTLFHKIKFDLQKAFMILFEMSAFTKSCSSTVMATRYEINQKTAWLFMSKVRKALSSCKSHPLKGLCQVNHYTLDRKGTIKQPEEPGSGTHQQKKMAIVINQAGKSGIKRAYAVKISSLSARELRKLFDGHIDTEAQVITEDKSRYRSLSGQYNLRQVPSNHKKEFELINRFTHGLTSWIRGIHHHVSDHFLQGYLNEYCYRFNRNRKKHWLFHSMVVRMMNASPAPYKILHNT